MRDRAREARRRLGSTPVALRAPCVLPNRQEEARTGRGSIERLRGTGDGEVQLSLVGKSN